MPFTRSERANNCLLTSSRILAKWPENERRDTGHEERGGRSIGSGAWSMPCCRKTIRGLPPVNTSVQVARHGASNPKLQYPNATKIIPNLEPSALSLPPLIIYLVRTVCISRHESPPWTSRLQAICASSWADIHSLSITVCCFEYSRTLFSGPQT